MEAKDYEVIKKRLLAEFKEKMNPEEEFHDTVTARLDARDIGSHQERITALYKKVGFKDRDTLDILCTVAIADLFPIMWTIKSRWS